MVEIISTVISSVNIIAFQLDEVVQANNLPLILLTLIYFKANLALNKLSKNQNPCIKDEPDQARTSR